MEFSGMDTIFTESDGSFFVKNIFVPDTANMVYAVASQVGFKPGISSKLLFFVRDTIDFGTIRLDSTEYDTISIAGIVVDTLYDNNPVSGAKVGVADVSAFSSLISVRGGFAGGFYNDTITTDNDGRFELKNFLVVKSGKHAVVYGATGFKLDNKDSTSFDTSFTSDSLFLTIRGAVQTPKIVTSDLKFSANMQNADYMKIFTLNGRRIYSGKCMLLNEQTLKKITSEQMLIVSLFKNGKMIFTGEKIINLSVHK